MAKDDKTGPKLFDRRLLVLRQSRARMLGPETFLIDRVALELGERLAAVLRRFEVAVDLGSPGEAIRHALAQSGRVGRIVTVSRFGGDVIADEELLPFAEGALDLVASALSFQFVNDLPGVLVQIRRALKPDGLLLAALAGGSSLGELRECFVQAESEIEGGLSPHVAPFADVRSLGALMQRAGFALPVVDSDRLTVRYPSVFELMYDLRRMGATNILCERNRRPLRRTTLMRMAEIYAQRFADPDGRIRATFDILWLSGWAPHASQQQPLKPGSAARRLSDVLVRADRRDQSR